MEVGSLILAPGSTTFDPTGIRTWGYGIIPNVITSMELERILSASGPTQGHLVRPSDHREVKRIAFLQCVGSRDYNKALNGYCSSVCCMYAIKEAMIAKEHVKDLDVSIFFMDMRTFGKEFERYYEKAKEEKFGRPTQLTMLYHWARLIETVYACEHAIELLEDPEITDTNIRANAEPRAGRGVGCVEAPRGTLIHDYSTDEDGLITRANLIVGTTHNPGSINMSVDQAARSLIRKGNVDEGILNKIEMAVRAYDP